MTQLTSSELTDEQIHEIAARIGSLSLNATRVHEIGGKTLTMLEDAGVIEFARAILRAAIPTPAAMADQPESYVRNCTVRSREGDGWLFHDTGTVILARLNGYAIMPAEEHARLLAAMEQAPASVAGELTYLDLLVEVLGVDLGSAAVEKFNKVSERVGFPDRIDLASASKASGVNLKLGDAE